MKPVSKGLFPLAGIFLMWMPIIALWDREIPVVRDENVGIPDP
jgi:hypothetical protein